MNTWSMGRIEKCGLFRVAEERKFVARPAGQAEEDWPHSPTRKSRTADLNSA